MESKHTPLPWVERDESKEKGLFRIIGADKRLLGKTSYCTVPSGTYSDKATAKANAAFIVKACNSYYEREAELAKKDAALIKAREALQWYANEEFQEDVIDVGSCGVATTYDSDKAVIPAQQALSSINEVLGELSGGEGE